MRDWLEKLKDPSRDIYERRYRLLALFCIVSLFLWWILSTATNFNPVRAVFFGLTDFVFVFFYLYALKSGRIQLIAGISAFFLVFGMLPIAFLFNGGIFAGAPNWCLIAMVFIIATIKGRLRNFFFAADIIVTLGMFALYRTHPELFVAYTGQTGFLNAIFSLVFTATLVCSMLFFQNYIARQELDISKEARNELQELNRSQNRFFSSMSHEIRTPINTIIGLNEMTLRDKDISEEAANNARNIQGASRMLLALINDVLDMSKIESGKMEIVPVTYDLGSLLSEVVNMIWGRASAKGLQFHVDVDSTLPSKLYGDEVRIKQVLVNLLNNSVKYTSEGSVRLSVQRDRIEGDELVMTYRVEDTGMGIRKEVLPHLFDAFRRVDEEKNRNIEGTGLGLAIVKQIVDLMEGEISVDSVYTKGSTFAVTLKQEIADHSVLGEISLKARSTAKEREEYRQSFEASGAKLLIVDDNELNLEVESKLLKDTKINIDLARSGAEALARTFRSRYDVIFMDHLMPEMDGIECLKAIRSQRGGLNHDTPVIILTANAGSENQNLYMTSGFDGYLLKPVSGQQLENALLKALPSDLVRMIGAETIKGEKVNVVGQHRRRAQILVSCESGADIPRDLTSRYHIPVINFHINTDMGRFYDDIDLDSDGLMSYMEDPSRSASSDAPSVDEYERFFAESLTEARHVVHISIAEVASNSYSNAKEAAAAFDNVSVIDSDAITSGTGLLVLYAAHLATQTDDVKLFLDKVKEFRSRIRTTFVVDSTEFLEKTGRITKATNIITTSFLLHPVIRFKDNSMTVAKIFTGERKGYRSRYVRYALREGNAIDKSLLFLTYVGMSEEELSTIIDLVRQEVSFSRIILQKASSAIAVNCGSGTFSLLFAVRDEDDDRDFGAFDFLPEQRDLQMTEREETVYKDEEEKDPVVPDKVIDPEVYGTLLERIYRTDGSLDYDEAMNYLGNEEMMMKTLEIFYKNIEKNASEIERMLEEGDIENYTIKVHALKSSARLIGATSLSEDARRLEEYGRAVRS